MAVNISATKPFTRQDTLRVNICDVVVDWDKLGRVSPPTEEEIQQMADSIDVFKQKQPVEVVINSAGTMSLVSGFTRYCAVKKLNEKTTDLNPVLLWVVVKTSKVQNAEDSLLSNIVENAHRKPTMGLDDAENQQKLRVLGWSNERIAALYRCTPGRVSQVSRLLGLVPSIRHMVLTKRLTCSAAEELGTLPEAEQIAWYDAFNSTGEVDRKANTAETKADVGRAKNESGESGRSMTLAAVRKWLVSVVESEDSPDLFKDFCVSFQQFTSGEADEAHVWHAVDAMLDVEKTQRRKAG